MTRIDFHSNVPDKLAYACRLIRKARAANCKLVVLTNPQQLTIMDDMLWNFSRDDFLPHVTAGDALAPQTPVILTANVSDALPHHQILVNLTDSTPTYFARFERMFEIIASEDIDKAAGRERYRFYQQRGYPLTHVVAKPT